ncbi:MAG: serine acetyltransferase [Alphaproteobacteria bacterium]|nr:serine acetyltransferase [Alphaproteobacteria bacterium]
MPHQGFFSSLNADRARYPGYSKSIVGLMMLLIFCPGFQFTLALRLQRLYAKIPFIGKALRKLSWYITTIYFGSDVDPHASIGAGIYFPHPYGIVIGSSVKIGNHVSINQNVTIGRRTPNDPADPVIHDNVCIHSGAVIIGGIIIGKNAQIGANAVVLSDVPENATAVGIPARCISN